MRELSESTVQKLCESNLKWGLEDAIWDGETVTIYHSNVSGPGGGPEDNGLIYLICKVYEVHREPRELGDQGEKQTTGTSGEQWPSRNRTPGRGKLLERRTSPLHILRVGGPESAVSVGRCGGSGARGVVVGSETVHKGDTCTTRELGEVGDGRDH